MNISSIIAWAKKNWMIIVIVIVVIIVVYKYYKKSKIAKSSEKQIAFVKPTKQAPEKQSPEEDDASKAFKDGMGEEKVEGLGDVKI